MMHAVRFTVTGLTLLCALTASAQPMGHGEFRGPPAFLQHVFPPGLIMQHQRDIELTAAQQEAITKAMQETQGKLVDLRWRFEAESQELAKMLDAERVDQSAALAQAERVMTIEQQIKQEHLAMLIRVKNQLTKTQQQKLQELRPRRGARRFRR
jgi:Spy/CpxP family protein refolding chaperone